MRSDETYLNAESGSAHFNLQQDLRFWTVPSKIITLIGVPRASNPLAHCPVRRSGRRRLARAGAGAPGQSRSVGAFQPPQLCHQRLAGSHDHPPRGFSLARSDAGIYRQGHSQHHHQSERAGSDSQRFHADQASGCSQGRVSLGGELDDRHRRRHRRRREIARPTSPQRLWRYAGTLWGRSRTVPLPASARAIESARSFRHDGRHRQQSDDLGALRRQC